MAERREHTGEHAEGYNLGMSLWSQGQTREQIAATARGFAEQGREQFAQGIAHAIVRIAKRQAAASGDGISPLPGGLSEGMSIDDFDETSLARGMLVELEHTPDPNIATKIVMDHLTESPRYYEFLAGMETKMNTPGASPNPSGLSPEQLSAIKASQQAYRKSAAAKAGQKASRKGAAVKTAKARGQGTATLMKFAAEQGMPMTKAAAQKVTTLVSDALALLIKAGFTYEQASAAICGGPIPNPVKLTPFQQKLLDQGRAKMAEMRAAGMTDKQIGEMFDAMHAGLGEIAASEMKIRTNPTSRARKPKTMAEQYAALDAERAKFDAEIASIVEDPEFIAAVPPGSWGYVKEILTSLIGNDALMLTNSFVRAMKSDRMQDFYVDTRVALKPVQSGYSKGKVTRAAAIKAIKALKEDKAAMKKQPKAKPARGPAKKNPTSSKKTSAPKSHGKGTRKAGKTDPTFACPTVEAAPPGPLTAAERKGVPSNLFALPGTRDLPIHDLGHTKASLSRLSKMFKLGTIDANQYRQAYTNIMEAYQCFGLTARKPPLIEVPGFPAPGSAPAPRSKPAKKPAKAKTAKAAKSKPAKAKPAKPAKAPKAKPAKAPKAKPAKKAGKEKTYEVVATGVEGQRVVKQVKAKSAAAAKRNVVKAVDETLAVHGATKKKGGPVKSGRGRPAKVESAVVETHGAGFKVVLSNGRTLLLPESSREQAIKAAATRAKVVEFAGEGVLVKPAGKKGKTRKAPKAKPAKAAKSKRPAKSKGKAAKARLSAKATAVRKALDESSVPFPAPASAKKPGKPKRSVPRPHGYLISLLEDFDYPFNKAVRRVIKDLEANKAPTAADRKQADSELATFESAYREEARKTKDQGDKRLADFAKKARKLLAKVREAAPAKAKAAKAKKPAKAPKVKAAKAKKPAKAPKVKAAKAKKPAKAPSSVQALRIDSPNALAVLTTLEGQRWAQVQEEDKLGPATFWGNKMAFDVLVEGGLQNSADLSDVLDGAGAIAGEFGTYLIQRGGVIRLLPGSTKEFVESAARLGIRKL